MRFYKYDEMQAHQLLGDFSSLDGKNETLRRKSLILYNYLFFFVVLHYLLQNKSNYPNGPSTALELDMIAWSF